ncbi:MAG: helix-hairpin-helix domain-containing protein [Alphaproteobacteria bacterium]|nr:helix-hairpin-helix domain-containing protein [Alphaproteobacteria bacterium]
MSLLALVATPSRSAWAQLTAALVPDDPDLEGITEALTAWPDALRCAPEPWRRAGDPRLALCRSLSGVYLRRRHGLSYFVRFYPDGVLHRVAVGGRGSTGDLVRQVALWFRRPHRRDTSPPIPYTFDGATLRYTLTPDHPVLDVEARFDADGVLVRQLTNRLGGRQMTWPCAWVDGFLDPPVDLNTDGVERLATLPGISMKRAVAVVAYRAARGPFGALEELAAVPGIGERTVAGLRGLVVVAG